MTEMVQGDVTSSNAAPSIPSDSSTSNSSVQNTPAQNVERTFRQSEVDEIAGRRASEAVERYKRNSSVASHQEQPQQQYAPSYQNNQNDYIEQMRKISAEETERALSKRVQDYQQEVQTRDAERVANSFLSKVESGKSKYEDFDSVIEDVGGYNKYPNLVFLAEQFDNPAEIMYELGNNPLKLASIEREARENHTIALAELKRLSKSLKINEQASSYRHPNEPLSQMRPTKAGAEKSGPLEVSDYKRKYRV